MTRIHVCLVSALYFLVAPIFCGFALSGAGSVDYSSPDVWYVESHSGTLPDWLILSAPVGIVAACFGALTGVWLLKRLREPNLSSARALSRGAWHGVLVNTLTWLSLLIMLAAPDSLGSNDTELSDAVQALCGTHWLSFALSWLIMMLALAPFAASVGVLLAWKIRAVETESATNTV